MIAEEDGPARRILGHLGVDTASLRQQLTDTVRAQEQQVQPQS